MSKRTPLEEFVPFASRGVLLLTVLDEVTGNPPEGGFSFDQIVCLFVCLFVCFFLSWVANTQLHHWTDKFCFCPSIDLVCCRNIWKESHKLLDPNKLSVVNSLGFSRVNSQTQNCFTSVRFFRVTKELLGWLGMKIPVSEAHVETTSNSIEGQTQP